MSEEIEAEETVEDSTATPDDPEGADKLGDPGKRALDAMKARYKAERDARKELERKLAEVVKKSADDGDKPDLEEIRRQAAEEARAEMLRERVLDKIEARAGRRFVDAEDAAALLLRGRDVDDFIDGGKVDMDAIAEALEELGESKPWLLATKGSGGSFDSGRGKKPDKAQLTREDLKGMTHAQIEKARREGRLDRLMGKSK